MLSFEQCIEKLDEFVPNLGKESDDVYWFGDQIVGNLHVWRMYDIKQNESIEYSCDMYTGVCGKKYLYQ